MKEKITIKSIQCLICIREGKKSPVIHIRAGFDQESIKKEYDTIHNHIHTYFNCKTHGAVSALVNDKPYSKPAEMFKELTFGMKEAKK